METLIGYEICFGTIWLGFLLLFFSKSEFTNLVCTLHGPLFVLSPCGWSLDIWWASIIGSLIICRYAHLLLGDFAVNQIAGQGFLILTCLLFNILGQSNLLKETIRKRPHLLSHVANVGRDFVLHPLTREDWVLVLPWLPGGLQSLDLLTASICILNFVIVFVRCMAVKLLILDGKEVRRQILSTAAHF